jgi:hypothetical protein
MKIIEENRFDVLPIGKENKPIFEYYKTISNGDFTEIEEK